MSQLFVGHRTIAKREVSFAGLSKDQSRKNPEASQHWKSSDQVIFVFLGYNTKACLSRNLYAHQHGYLGTRTRFVTGGMQDLTIAPPPWFAACATNTSIRPYEIDNVACKSLSSIIRANDLTLQQATQFFRGESISDTRPNKALDMDRLRLVLRGYPHLDLLIQIAERGIAVEWKHSLSPRRPPPKNHGSFRRYLPAISKA
ncbi:unnamed protein product [Phytophthora lilii]|uniref:Unnamed protein product n=1 Tax=Phytophthora lilii TaxID=2077276 RepID=A0A9W6UFJ9_9STRA|nr:unnamed protein product [Phytophthora lilii]